MGVKMTSDRVGYKMKTDQREITASISTSELESFEICNIWKIVIYYFMPPWKTYVQRSFLSLQHQFVQLFLLNIRLSSLSNWFLNLRGWLRRSECFLIEFFQPHKYQFFIIWAYSSQNIYQMISVEFQSTLLNYDFHAIIRKIILKRTVSRAAKRHRQETL